MAGMNRRELLQLGAATVAAGVVPRPAWAQASAAPPSGSATTTASGNASVARIRIDAYSRTLHWLRKPEEIAEACHQIGNTTIDLTVRTYPGHVDPAKVTTDLPPFVKALERGGITVTSIAAEITDDQTPNVDAILGTMSSLGIRHHWWRGFSFNATQPYRDQVEALKPRIERLVKLEAKYGTKAMYHPGGGPYFDILDFLRNFDPRYVSVHYDTGHWLQVSQANMAAHLRLGAAYIGGFVWKDELVEKVDPATADTAGRATGAADNAADPAQTAAAGRGGRAGAAGAAAGAGRGGGGGRGGGSVNGFRTRQVPVGTGMVDFALAARTLKEINFDGPTECQPEWTGLGGAESGRDTLTLPRETVIGLLKRDYETIHTALVAAGAAG